MMLSPSILVDFFPVISVQSPIGMLTYQPGIKMFTSPRFSSKSGNDYTQGIVLSEQLLIIVAIGEGKGGAQFVNSIKVIPADDTGRVVAQRNFVERYQFFSLNFIQQEAVTLLYSALTDARSKRQMQYTDEQLQQLAADLVQGAFDCNHYDLIETKPIPLLST